MARGRNDQKDGSEHPFICVLCKQPLAPVPGGLCRACIDELLEDGGGNAVVVKR